MTEFQGPTVFSENLSLFRQKSAIGNALHALPPICHLRVTSVNVNLMNAFEASTQ